MTPAPKHPFAELPSLIPYITPAMLEADEPTVVATIEAAFPTDRAAIDTAIGALDAVAELPLGHMVRLSVEQAICNIVNKLTGAVPPT